MDVEGSNVAWRDGAFAEITVWSGNRSACECEAKDDQHAPIQQLPGARRRSEAGGMPASSRALRGGWDYMACVRVVLAGKEGLIAASGSNKSEEQAMQALSNSL